jgi:hypothetical protein
VLLVNPTDCPLIVALLMSKVDFPMRETLPTEGV